MKLSPLSDQANSPSPPPKKESKRFRLPRFSPRKIRYGILAIAAGLLLFWAFRPVPVRVTAGQAERGPLQVTVEAEGKTRVRDRFTIAAPVNGHLERIQLQEGDSVQVGTLVAQIEPLPLTASVQEALGRLAEWQAQRAGVATQRPKRETLEQAEMRIQTARANYQQAEAWVAATQATLAQARRDRQRAQQLEARGAISRKDREAAELNETTQARNLDAAQLAAKAAASEVEVARAALEVLQKEQSDPDYLLSVYDARIASTEAELARLRDRANRTEIRSPVKGRVLRVLQKSAQYVTEGLPLLEIGDTSNLELVIDVLSSDAEQIKPGNLILIERPQSPLLQAKVRLIEPAAFTKISALGIEEQRVNVIGDFVDFPTALGDAYRLETKIVVWEGKDVLKVPLSSLFRCTSGWCVFVIEGQHAQRRSVAIRQRSTVEAEIQSGLQGGELVILHPNEQIAERTRVKAENH